MGNRIKQLRKQSGLSQKQIGWFLDVDQSMVARIEKGERALTTVQLSKIASLFGCTEEYVLGDETEEKPIRLAFRLEEPSLEAMHIVAAVNKVAANINLLNRILEAEHAK